MGYLSTADSQKQLSENYDLTGMLTMLF